MSLGRRRFIGLMASAAAGTALGMPSGRLIHDVLSTADQPLDPPGGPEDFVLSVCSACPGACGVRVRRMGERIVKLSGNPLHPVSGGRLCPKGQAAIQALRHPDRVLTPLRRVGSRGSLASFKPDSWEHALADITARLASIRDQKRAESLVFVHGGGGAGTRLASRFLEAFGSPNDIHLDRGGDADALALFHTQGIHATPAYDIRAADYVLSLGSEFLEAAPAPVFTTRAYGDFRQTRAARRGKFVHIDPRLSLTASSADEWIAIRPGTHGVFALGVAAAIIDEDLYDREFVAEHCAGFDELRSFLEQRFGLEAVAARTGVGVNTILRVARELAGSRGLAIGPRKGPLLPGSLFDHLSAHVLNALAGNIDQRGGVLVPDTVLNSGESRDTDALQNAEVLLVAGADPVFTTTGNRFRGALERVPFVVSFATIPTDTALWSEWILPETHFLEQSDLRTSGPGVPFASASLAQRATEPSKDARPMGDVVLELARRLHLDAALPWTNVDAFIRSEMDRLHGARRGALMGTPFDEAWVRMMEGAGWWAPGYSTADELWERAQTTGGWWDPFYDHGDWTRVLRTSSGRFEFRADLLKQVAAAKDDSESSNPAALSLQLFEPLAVSGGSGAELPFLQSILDPTYAGGWNTWGEIHPNDAHALRVRDGMPLRVSSPQASIVVTARVTSRVVPGVIAIPVGLGRESGGRWAAGVGANPLRLVDGNIDATRVVVAGERS